MAQKYPIGIQSFESLITGGYVYVDKTEFVHNLVSKGKYFFLSRPRRFGKSLLLSTIKAFYEGKRELFEGLAIRRHEHDWEPHPVINIAFNAWNYKNADSLAEMLDYAFRPFEQIYGTERETAPNSERFRYIIQQACLKTGKKVVILIDEYDKPLLDTVHDMELQDAFRAELKSVYGNLKSCDEYIEFAMLTGVTRFSKLSIFSDLNNLNDISMRADFSAICGITLEEIQENFSEGVKNLADMRGLTLDQTYAQLARYYDGYHFATESPDMYNPFSLMNALDAKEFGSYWFTTGTPTFLIELIKKGNFPLKDFNNYKTSENELLSVPAKLDNPIPVLYQAGYLTIKGHNEMFRTLILGYPNQEVEHGFLDNLFVYYTSRRESSVLIEEFILDLQQGNAEGFMNRLQSLFSGYHYDQIDLGDLELHYRNVIYLVMKLMGFYTEAEMRTASGRIDLLVGTHNYLYLFEFKLNKSSQEAMDQINDRDYLLPYKADGRKIIKIGANFDDKIRSISDWMVEEF